MVDAFHDVYDSSEIEIFVATEYDSGSSSWNYQRVSYRRDFSPDNPDNKRPVHDKLSKKGDKLTRVEKSVSVSQEFRGYTDGLIQYENMEGLLVKAEIVPNAGTAPTENAIYYTNWSTSSLELPSISDEGEFNSTLGGSFDQRSKVEPDGSEEWATTV
jgi:hypothetical protein